MIKLIEYYLVAYLSVGFVIATWFTLTQYSFVKFVYKSKSNAFIVEESDKVISVDEDVQLDVIIDSPTYKMAFQFML